MDLFLSQLLVHQVSSQPPALTQLSLRKPCSSMLLPATGFTSLHWKQYSCAGSSTAINELTINKYLFSCHRMYMEGYSLHKATCHSSTNVLTHSYTEQPLASEERGKCLGQDTVHLLGTLECSESLNRNITTAHTKKKIRYCSYLQKDKV